MLADPENENLEQQFFFYDDDEIEEQQQEVFDGQLSDVDEVENPDEVDETMENVELEGNDDDYIDMSDDEVDFVNDEPSTSSQAKVKVVDNETSMDQARPSSSGMQRRKRKASQLVKYRESSSSDQEDKDISQDIFDDSDEEFEINPKRKVNFSLNDSD